MRANRERPTFEIERALAPGAPIAGLDEVGRGPLAGPVVAAAVVLDPARIPDGIDDSKRLSATARERLARELRRVARVGVGAASVSEIGTLNILRASLLAMERAFAALPCEVTFAIVDGNRLPALPCAAIAVVAGDRRSLSIAAASIVAKVARDRIMCALARRWPAYGFERHMGYPTAAHRAALAAYGATPHHRLGFAGVH